jgi:hypothetical protein
MKNPRHVARGFWFKENPERHFSPSLWIKCLILSGGYYAHRCLMEDSQGRSLRRRRRRWVLLQICWSLVGFIIEFSADLLPRGDVLWEYCLTGGGAHPCGHVRASGQGGADAAVWREECGQGGELGMAWAGVSFGGDERHALGSGPFS